jgi:hypothetical protein
MADKKPAPTSSEDGHSIARRILFFLLVLMAIGTMLAGSAIEKQFNNFFSFNDEDGEVSRNNSDRDDDFSFGEFFSSGKIKVNKNVANKGEVKVRNSPAGQILGLQKIGEIAKVLEGPVEKFNIDWWRLDYKNAPDGWVSDDEVTASTRLFSFFNFFPWVFGGLKKVLILIGILAIIAIAILYSKIFTLNKLKKQKEDLKKEMLKPQEMKMKEALKTEDDFVLPIAGLPIGENPQTENVTNRRWKNIQSLVNSHNLNDWKQAIIEADIMLDEMLEKMGYKGDSIGDKLKQIEASDFLTLNQAWEAHKVRNQIAHQGSNYILSHDEAERVIDLYSQVFKEFYFI